MIKRYKKAFVLLVLLCLCGCVKEPKADESINTTEELVSEEYFLEYYGMTREDIGDFDLQAMIDQYELTEESLLRHDWSITVENSIENGRVFGYDASDITEGEQREATKKDDVTTAKYVLVYGWVTGDGCLEHPQQIMIDIEKGKTFYSDMNVWNDFSKAEVIKDLDEENKDEILISLNNLKIYKWCFGGIDLDIFGGDEVGDYDISLYIVLENGDVIKENFAGPGNSTKFDDWYYELLSIVR